MFVHLRLHSEFSIVDSTCRIDDVVQAAADDQQPALAITAGARLFWDDTNRRLTTTATGNFQVGIAALAALAADTTVRAWLNRVPAVGT
jgi:hypothetical protein